MTRTKVVSSCMKRRSRYSTRSRTTIKLNPLTFQKMVKELIKDLYGVTDMGGTKYHFQSPALLRLQEASEHYLEIMVNQIKNIAIHAGRRHVSPRDFQIWKRITGLKITYKKNRQSLCSIFDSLPPKSKVWYIIFNFFWFCFWFFNFKSSSTTCINDHMWSIIHQIYFNICI